MRVVFGVFGVAVSIVSAMFVVMAISDLITGDSETSRSTLFGLLALFTGAGYWGLHLANQSFRWWTSLRLRLPHRRSTRELEEAVLSYVTSASSRVTVVEIAAHCKLTVDESKAILDHFAARNVADLVVTEDGTLIYDFDLLTPKEKARAEDVLS